jgi:hypothetical protein
MRFGWLAAAVAWLLAVGAGFAVLWRYAAAAGPPSIAPAVWPAGSRLPRAADGATLVMFVHPRCACSRASLDDLAHLMSRVPVHAVIAFIVPRGVEPGWKHSGLYDQAARLPGAVIADDEGGVESRRFGAATSGATLLYDARGALLFAGGITDVRGHAGDSFGEERMVALLSGGAADRRDSPVFGCRLEEETKR